MRDFIFDIPTKVYFGKDAELNVGPVLKEMGATNVLIHYGGGSAIKSGLIGRIEKTLQDAGIAYTMLGGVSPNPKVQLVREGVALCKEKGIDFILAVGGGSAIDSSKSMALACANDADPWDLVTGKVKPTSCLPVATVLTLAAAGSEMSFSHVLSDLTIPAKKGLNCDLVRPRVSFLNPELTFTVSPYQTACGVVDIMMHTLERYTTPEVGADLTERMAEGLLVAVKEAGAIAVKEPDNYVARANIMWAGSVSHNGITGFGKYFEYMLAHQIEHSISAMFDHVSHGAGLAVCYPAWVKFAYKFDVTKFYNLAVNVWGVPADPDHKEEVCLKSVTAMKEYFRSIGMPVSLRELGIGPEYYEPIADNVVVGGKRKLFCYEPISKEDFIEILRMTDED